MAKNWEHGAGARPNRRAWPIFFFLALAVVSLLLHMAKAHRQKELRAVTQRAAAIVRDRPLAKVKALRSLFYQIQYYLNYPSAASYAVADFVRRLCAAVPPRQLLDLQIDPGLQNLAFRLTLRIAAGSPGSARRAADACLDALQKIPEITRIALADPDPLAAGGGGNRVYSFAVSGQAEMP